MYWQRTSATQVLGYTMGIPALVSCCQFSRVGALFPLSFRAAFLPSPVATHGKFTGLLWHIRVAWLMHDHAAAPVVATKNVRET
jgi:hypothetical protein